MSETGILELLYQWLSEDVWEERTVPFADRQLHGDDDDDDEFQSSECKTYMQPGLNEGHFL
jgi:hypothetical protein